MKKAKACKALSKRRNVLVPDPEGILGTCCAIGPAMTF